MFGTSSSVEFRFGEPIYQKSGQRRLIQSKSPPLRYRLTDAESQNVGTVLLDDADRHGLDIGRHAHSSSLPKAQYSGLDDEVRDVENLSALFGHARCLGTRALSSRI